MKILEDYYRAERNNLIKRIKNRAGSVENAEDVIQEAFCRAIQYYGAFNPKGEFGSWFSGILENTLKDFKKEDRLGGLTTNVEGIEENIHDEIVDHFLPHLKNLSPIHKKIVNLYFKYGYSVKDISVSLGLPFYTTKRVIERFRKKIRAND